MNRLNKKLISEIIIGSVGIIIIILTFIIQSIKNKSSEYEQKEDNPTFKFILVYENNNEVINDVIDFTIGENLYHILDRKYDIEYRNDGGLKAITKINEYSTDWTNNYFSIYIDGNYSNYGSESIFVTENMEVKFVWKSTN